LTILYYINQTYHWIFAFLIHILNQSIDISHHILLLLLLLFTFLFIFIPYLIKLWPNDVHYWCPSVDMQDMPWLKYCTIFDFSMQHLILYYFVLYDIIFFFLFTFIQQAFFLLLKWCALFSLSLSLTHSLTLSLSLFWSSHMIHTYWCYEV